MPTPGPDGTTWDQAVLAGLGVTSNGVNNTALLAWAHTEGMPDSTHNWLAATDPRPGSTRWNSAGVQVYPTFAVGVAVLVTKLSSTLYAGIRKALPSNKLDVIWSAINESPWCHGCQGGTYPNVLYSMIARGVTPVDIRTVNPIPAAPHQTGPSPDSWDGTIHTTAGLFNSLAAGHDKAAAHIHGL